MTVTMKDGFKIDIEEKHLNDWQLLKMLRSIDKGEPALVVDVAELLFGDQVDALAKHLETDGVTSVTAMVEAMREIMEAAKEVKNS